jgi:hypothetical protein
MIRSRRLRGEPVGQGESRHTLEMPSIPCNQRCGVRHDDRSDAQIGVGQSRAAPLQVGSNATVLLGGSRFKGQYGHLAENAHRPVVEVGPSDMVRAVRQLADRDCRGELLVNGDAGQVRQDTFWG